MFVNNLRKAPPNRSNEVADRCSRIVQLWKDKLRVRTTEQAAADKREKAKDTQKTESTKKTHTAPDDDRAGSTPAKKTRTDMPELARTGDATRDKCVEMLYSALMVEDGLDPEHAAGLAGDIERALFAASGRTVDARYKATFRSKYLNLKDRANPDLRQSVLYGGISVERFLGMSAQEMASEERKRETASINAQNLLQSRAAVDNQAETGQFKCGKCQQRKCKYYQLQTRSADEPMTTFVTCVNCGNRWKFC